MSENIVELSHVTKQWGTFIGLNDVSLNVKRGEILTLLGPSGCGKSTLMRIVAGFESATQGNLRIDGRDMARIVPEKRPVNMVFQRYALFPHLDVFDNVAFGPRLRGEPKAKVNADVERMLDLVQLQSFKNRWISEISGGQAQRVALARALINRPSVLLLDEPLAALDLKIRHQMLDELKRIHSETGTTFMYVTHDQDEAMILSNRVVLMNKGEIEQIGTPNEMYGAPRTLFCAKFFGETNILDGTVDSASGVIETPLGRLLSARRANAGSRLHVSLRPEAIRLSSAHGVPDINGIEGTVEDVDFIGSRILYRVRHDTGAIIRCQEPRGPQGIRFAAGERVGMAWDAASVVTVEN